MRQRSRVPGWSILLPLHGRSCASFLPLRSLAGQDAHAEGPGVQSESQSSCRPSDCMRIHYGFQPLCLEGHRKLPSGVPTCADALAPPTPAHLHRFFLGLVMGPLPYARLRALLSNERSSQLTPPQGFSIGQSSAVQGPSLLPAPPCLDFRAWLN